MFVARLRRGPFMLLSDRSQKRGAAYLQPLFSFRAKKLWKHAGERHVHAAKEHWANAEHEDVGWNAG